MDSVTFIVPGKPQGKARAKTYHNKNMGFTTTVTPDQTVLYENFIKECFLQKSKGTFYEKGTPVSLQITARFLPMSSVSKKRRKEMLERKELPLKKPDIDNIVKVVADALNGVAYHDDTQIARVESIKIYADSKEGLEITVGKIK